MQNTYKHCFSFCFLCFLCVLGVGSSDSGNNKGPDEIEAYIMSKKFVEQNLKAPSTAVFCSYSDANIMNLGGGRFRVSGFVDAQNSFGASIRTQYSCILKSTGGSWTLESLDM